MHLFDIPSTEVLKLDGVSEPDRAALWAMRARLLDAPESANATLARHCADLLIAVADIVNRKDGESIELGGWVEMFDHTCHHHVEAALYLLAHAFEPAAGGMSPSIDWATTIVDGLLDRAG